MFRYIWNQVPWNRPTLADLLREKRHRIRALMLGAGAGPALKARQSALLDKLLNGTIPDHAYKARDAELTTEIAICRAQRIDAQLDEFDLDAALDTAEYMFKNLARIWDKLTVEWRIRFQQAIFSDGLTYKMEQKFGTAVSSSFTEVLGGREMLKSPNRELARPRGVEPRLPG